MAGQDDKVKLSKTAFKSVLAEWCMDDDDDQLGLAVAVCCDELFENGAFKTLLFKWHEAKVRYDNSYHYYFNVLAEGRTNEFGLDDRAFYREMLDAYDTALKALIVKW